MASRNAESGDESWYMMVITVPLILGAVKSEQSEAGRTAEKAERADDLKQYYVCVGEAHLQGFMNREMLDYHWKLKDTIHAVHII